MNVCSEPGAHATIPDCLEPLCARARKAESLDVAVIEAADRDVLQSVRLAQQVTSLSACLIGDAGRIGAIAEEIDLDLTGMTLVDTTSPEDSVAAAVGLVKDGKASCLQKGKISTDVLMRGLLSRTNGIRTGEVLSHLLCLMSDRLDRPLLITDAGVIPRPDIEEKKLLIERAIAVAGSLGIARPRVALLSASEKVSRNIASSVEADALTRWWADTDRGENAQVFGPLSLDLSLSGDAAAKKGITGPVAGCADILVAPDIETANAIYKSLTLFAEVIGAGIVLGAAVPILLTSRADPPLSRVASVMLAKCVLSSSGHEPSASQRLIACPD